MVIPQEGLPPAACPTVGGVGFKPFFAALGGMAEMARANRAPRNNNGKLVAAERPYVLHVADVHQQRTFASMFRTMH